NILQRVVDIRVSHDEPHKRVVVQGRNYSDYAGDDKDDQRVKQWPTDLPHNRWHLVLPEVDYPVASLAFVAIDLEMNPRNEIVEIGGGTTGRILRPREGKVVGELDEHFEIGRASCRDRVEKTDV